MPRCDFPSQQTEITILSISLLKVAESVRLQAELHEKEKTILRQQRKRCQKVYKDLETLRSKMNEAQGI